MTYRGLNENEPLTDQLGFFYCKLIYFSCLLEICKYILGFVFLVLYISVSSEGQLCILEGNSPCSAFRSVSVGSLPHAGEALAVATLAFDCLASHVCALTWGCDESPVSMESSEVEWCRLYTENFVFSIAKASSCLFARNPFLTQVQQARVGFQILYMTKTQEIKPLHIFMHVWNFSLCLSAMEVKSYTMWLSCLSSPSDTVLRLTGWWVHLRPQVSTPACEEAGGAGCGQCWCPLPCWNLALPSASSQASFSPWNLPLFKFCRGSGPLLICI